MYYLLRIHIISYWTYTRNTSQHNKLGNHAGWLTWRDSLLLCLCIQSLRVRRTQGAVSSHWGRTVQGLCLDILSDTMTSGNFGTSLGKILASECGKLFYRSSQSWCYKTQFVLPTGRFGFSPFDTRWVFSANRVSLMEDVMHLGIHETQIMLPSRTKAIAVNLIKNDKDIYIVIQCNSISSYSQTWVLQVKQHQSISGAMRLCLIPGAGQPWMPFPLPSWTVPIIPKFNWLRLLVAPIPIHSHG